MKRNGLRADLIVSAYSVAQGRNNSVQLFLDGDKRFLLQLDDDLAPDDDTSPIMDINSDAAIAYCSYPPRKQVRFNPEMPMPGCLRMRRDILEAMEPPWFQPEYDSTGGAQIDSEERLVIAKAKAMGHEPVMVGHAGHLVEVIAKYKNGQAAFMWPHSK